MSGEDSDIQKSKKRDASSPLKESNYVSKKSKQLLGLLSETSDFDTDSNTDSNPDNEAESETEMASSLQAKSTLTDSKSVLTDSDLDRIACRVNDMMAPVMKTMIDSSLREVRREYDQKFEEQSTRIQELSDDNDELRSEICVHKVEVAKLQKRDDEQEQYSRRNSIRIMGIKESDKRPTSDIVLDIARQQYIIVNETDIDRSHRVGQIIKRDLC